MPEANTSNISIFSANILDLWIWYGLDVVINTCIAELQYHGQVWCVTTDHITRVSCQKGPTHHAYVWQIGPFWQDILDNI